MKPILTSEQMAAADRHSIDKLGIAGIDLMESAARACFEELAALLGRQDRVAIVAGPGNNGGDGFAVARKLIEGGHHSRVFLALPARKLAGDALVNFERLRAMGVAMTEIDESWRVPEDVTWIVDALFGTGLNRPVRGMPATLIERINACPAKVCAVDLPSGLAGSQGALIGPAAHADLTVTFQFLKVAHAVAPACLRCGRVVVRDIGICCGPGAKVNTFLLEADDYRRAPRDVDSHKGSYGTLALVGGFAGMEGAASLGAMAALRFGAGKVRIFTNCPHGRFFHDSVMVAAIDDHPNETDYHAWVIGPGLSRNEAAFAAVARFNLDRARVVWDADGLYYLKRNMTASRGADWVMTPHPGEAAMLLETSTEGVRRDRIAAIRRLGSLFPGGWIVLKGYRTLILSPEGGLFVCGTGNAALANAGSGDVLSGMIGALLAQGLPLDDAVLSACLRHGMAADRWVRHYRDYAMIAEDIIEDLKH